MSNARTCVQLQQDAVGSRETCMFQGLGSWLLHAHHLRQYSQGACALFWMLRFAGSLLRPCVRSA